MTILPPDVATSDEPRVCVKINRKWVSYVIGLLDRASKEWYWADDQYDATQAIEQIIYALSVGNCEPNMLGTVHAFAGNTLPDGALWCDGATHEREDYPELYALLEAYQTDADHFTTPDMRSRFVVGVNEDEPPEGLSNYDLAQTGGAESVILTGFQAGTHQHGIPNHNHTYDRPRNTGLEAQEFATGTPVPVPSIDASINTGMASLETEEYPPIEASAHENRPPFIALRYFIVAR